MKKLLLLLPALLASPTARAYSDVTFSPVQVVDYLEASRHYNDFDTNTDLRAVSEFSTIVYDRYIRRPWNEKYFPEANRRWSALRKEFCPHLRNFCALPGAFAAEGDLFLLLLGLDDPATVRELQASLRNKSTPYYLDKVTLLDAPAAGEPPLYNLLLSGRESHTTYPESRFWDMAKDSVRVKEKEFLLVTDVASYAGGFAGEPSNTYLSVNREGDAVLNLDAMKSKAMHFAKIWKNRMAAVREAPELAKIPTYLYSDEYVLAQVFQRYANRFEYHYLTLLEKLRSLPKERVGDVAERFAAERREADYPEEVYQFVSYELFRELLLLQAKYFALAREFRAGLNLKRQVWESLLAMQSELDPRLVLYFISLEVAFPRNAILNQFVNPGVAPAYFYEHLKAILDLQEFSGRNAYPRFVNLLKAPELWDSEFVKEEAPEVYAELYDPTTKKLRDVFSLPETEQKRIFNLYLHNSEGKVRFRPFNRLVLSLVLRLSDDDGSELARYVHEVRKAEFAR